MKFFNIYKRGRYGWFHVTSLYCENLTCAINVFRKDWNGKIGKELGNYKITGL